jgi:hypothetical protein
MAAMGAAKKAIVDSLSLRFATKDERHDEATRRILRPVNENVTMQASERRWRNSKSTLNAHTYKLTTI